MKTKEMKKEEAKELLRNKKFMCKNKEESLKLQKKMFSLGIKWGNGSQDVEPNQFLFYTDEDAIMTCGLFFSHFISSPREIMEIQDLLDIQIKEEDKPKFDPKSLQPFDKVVVRNGDNKIWRCTLFSHIDEEDEYFPIICIFSCWSHCVPFNDETKHLVGTTEEAPDFYKIWK